MKTGSLAAREELKQLYESLGPRLLLYLERRTGDAALAADLVQDVFLRLLESPIRVGSEGEAKIYLYRTVHSKLIDHARRGQRDKRWRVWLRLASPAVEADDSDDISRVFRTLKPRDATLLWLAYVEEMNHNEIAKRQGVVTPRPHRTKGLDDPTGSCAGVGHMRDDHAKSWMKELAASGPRATLPEFDRMWAMRRLEEEFERRRKLDAPLFWMDIALQGAAGLAAVLLLTW